LPALSRWNGSPHREKAGASSAHSIRFARKGAKTAFGHCGLEALVFLISVPTPFSGLNWARRMVLYPLLSFDLMRRALIFEIMFLWAVLVQSACALQPPAGLVSRTGDRSIVLHWDRNPEPGVSGYKVYRSADGGGSFALLNTSGPVSTPGFCDLSAGVINGQTNYYRVTAVSAGSQESAPSSVLAAVPHPFSSDDEFLEYLQQVHFDYFWYLANPTNGLVPDRTMPNAACSIAAVGFGLTSLAIGIDHGWISRSQGAARVLTTLNTFLKSPQGTSASGTIGYRGWFYHFLNMNTATRSAGELSSIDTALLLAGMLDAKQYFDGPDPTEKAIRDTSDAIFNRVDWTWMLRGTNVLSMGWIPGSGFIASDWVGYNEAMILYCLGMGTSTNPLPVSSWTGWTRGYSWGTLLRVFLYALRSFVWAPVFALLD